MDKHKQQKIADTNQEIKDALSGSQFDEHKGMVSHLGFPFFIADKNDDGSVEEDVRNHK